METSNRFPTGRLLLAGLALFSAASWAPGQVVLLSLPNPTISSFQPTYSNNVYVHGTTIPTSGSGTYSYVTSETDTIGSAPSNASCFSVLTPTPADHQYAAAVYDTNGTLGTGSGGVVNFSKINTFTAYAGAKLTMTADFASIGATRAATGLINPASAYINDIQQAGQGQVSQALPGVISQVYFNGNGSSLALDGLTDVACYEPWSSTGGYNYDSTPYYAIVSSPNFALGSNVYFQLQTTFVNNGNGTATVTAALYSLSAMGTNPAVGATAMATVSATITLSSVATQPSSGSTANYDLGTTSGSTLGLLYYTMSTASSGANATDIDDITLTEPQQGTSGTVLAVNDAPEWVAVSDQTALVNEYVASNTKFVRIGADWDVFQPTSAGTYPTGYSATYVARLDNFFQLCAANNIHILVIAAYAPSWANGGTNASGYAPTSAHYADYAAYCEWIMQRYYTYVDTTGHRVLEAIELWNEPDLCALFFQGQGWADEAPAAATAYGNMVVTAGSALMSLRSSLGCTDVHICAPVISDPHSASWSANGPNSGWIDSFYAVPGVVSDYDVFTWHSYWYNAGSTGYNPPEVPQCWNTSNTTLGIMSKLTTTTGYFDPIWPKMVAAGDSTKRLWMTETGAAVSSSLPPAPPAAPHSNSQLTYAEECALFSDTLNTLVSADIPTLDRVYWFRFTEYDNYGLLDSSNNPKLVYTAYQDESKSGTLLSMAHLANGGFETPSTTTYVADPTGTGVAWTFTGTCGVQHNGSAFGAIQAPEGLQTAYIQSITSPTISQSIYFPAGDYTINILAAQRSGYPVNPIKITVAGTSLSSTISPTSTSFASYASAQFTVSTAGNYMVTLAGTVSGGDSEAFIDDVCVVRQP